MPTPFRLLDSGVRPGRMQIAFDQAMTDLHKDGRSPDTVRFMRFPPTVLVGRHQAVAHEIRVEDCLADGVDMVRRITGGGAIYLDEGQVGWEIVLSRRRLPMATLADYTQSICEAVAAGLSQTFGIEARFRPRNDIEVGGRKLCGTGGFFDGDTLVYQGTVLVDVDPGHMATYLQMPTVPAEARDTIGHRLTTLKALLGNVPSVDAVQQAVARGLETRLGLTLASGGPTGEEEALARHYHDDEIGTDEFVFSIDDPRQPSVYEASKAGPGGTVTVFLRTEGLGVSHRVRDCLVTGDFFINPPRLVLDAEAAVRGAPLAEAGPLVAAFFERSPPALATVAPADIAAAVASAARRAAARD